MPLSAGEGYAVKRFKARGDAVNRVSLLLIAVVVTCGAACEGEVATTYRAEVHLGSEIANLVREVGPVAVRGNFERLFPDESLTLSSHEPVTEVCVDEGNDIWLRTSLVTFEPSSVVTRVLGGKDLSSERGDRSWELWGDESSPVVGGALDVRIAAGAPCPYDFTLEIAVIPLAAAYGPESSEEVGFRCRQSGDADDRFAPPILEGEPLEVRTECADIGRAFELDDLAADQRMVVVDDNLPPDTPRPTGFGEE